MRDIQVGDTFHSSYADGNPEWTVTDISGEYLTAEVRDDLDWNGVRKGFLVSDVQRSLAYSASLSNLAVDADAWWDAQPLGRMVHYHNGFGQFIRGYIDVVGGRNKFVPIALCGTWAACDLPRREADGTIYEPYYARLLSAPQSESAWRPSTGCVYEFALDTGYSWTKGDPTGLPNLDLTVPDMTPEQAETARQVGIMARIADITADDSLSYEQRAADIKNLAHIA
jgi:hypothetical protein